MWHVTREMWHMVQNMWGDVNTLFQTFSYLALTVWEWRYSKELDEKDVIDSVTGYRLPADRLHPVC